MIRNVFLTIAAICEAISALITIFNLVFVNDSELRRRRIKYLIIAFVICAIILAVLLFPPTSKLIQQVYAQDQDLSLSNSSLASSSSNSIWLESLPPVDSREGNLFIGKWKNRRFSIEGVNYSHGIGMYLNGTDAEVLVNAPPGNWQDSCAEVYVDYQLDKAYSSISFNIGADDSEPKYFGGSDTHGVARVIISDADTGSILYDSSWFDYSFAQYNVKFNLKGVDTLRVALQACGGNDSKYHYTLNIALVDAKLYLVN